MIKDRDIKNEFSMFLRKNLMFVEFMRIRFEFILV